MEPRFHSRQRQPFSERCRSLLAGDFSSAIASKLAPTIAYFRLERGARQGGVCLDAAETVKNAGSVVRYAEGVAFPGIVRF
jgi:hypothetical protein